jgi:hypothetical protein
MLYRLSSAATVAAVALTLACGAALSQQSNLELDLDKFPDQNTNESDLTQQQAEPKDLELNLQQFDTQQNDQRTRGSNTSEPTLNLEQFDNTGTTTTDKINNTGSASREIGGIVINEEEDTRYLIKAAIYALAAAMVVFLFMRSRNRKRRRERERKYGTAPRPKRAPVPYDESDHR